MLSGAVAIASSAGLAAGAQAATPTPPAGKPYVAFGDSYAAGPGLTGYDDSQAGSSCQRSTINYPSRIAAAYSLSASQWQDYSCAGALTSYANNSHTYGGLEDQVFNWANSTSQQTLGTTTQLVTISIGGNDNWNGKRGVYDTLVRCGGSQVEGANGTTCATGVNAPVAQSSGLPLPLTTDITAQGFYNAISPTITEIKRVAPQAMIEIVGYPTILPSGHATCNGGAAWYFEDSELAYLQPILNALKAAQQGAVSMYPTSAKVRFVDTQASGHDICQGASTQWVQNPIYVAPAGFASGLLHPTALGMQAFANLAITKFQAG
jgi:hypothetical protein